MARKSSKKVEVKRDARGRILPGQQSINVKGRPHKEDTLSDMLRAQGNFKLPKKLPPTWGAALTSWRLAGFPEPRTLVELDAAILWSTSLDGDGPARKERHDRMYGKVPQPLSDPDGGSLLSSLAEFLASKNGCYSNKPGASDLG